MTDGRTYRQGQRVKLGGVWQKTSAKGNTYFTGRLGAARILIMENTRRQGDGDPTHEVFLCEVVDQPDGRGTAGNQAAGGRNGAGRTSDAPGNQPGPGGAPRANHASPRQGGTRQSAGPDRGPEPPPFEPDGLPDF